MSLWPSRAWPTACGCVQMLKAVSTPLEGLHLLRASLKAHWRLAARGVQQTTWVTLNKWPDGDYCLFVYLSIYFWQGKICFFFFFFFKFIYLFIYFWLCWVFVSVQGLSPVAASGGHSSSRWAGLLLSRPLPLRSAGSVVVAHGPSRSAACGIFPDRGTNPCPLHWQADS